MQTVTKIDQLRFEVSKARLAGKSIGFVPTMGALHEGHLSLINAATQQSDFVVVSIFVNPTQFGPSEDLDAYPRDLKADQDKCISAGVDLLFAPNTEEMYPQKNLTWIDVEHLTDHLCGPRRPGHFRGVTTVCMKLFNSVQPDKVFFGQKDAQQSVVIRRMIQDMNMPIEMVICPTVRESDGLAMSSRNQYLKPDQRKAAVFVSKALDSCCQLFMEGIRDTSLLKKKMTEILSQSPLIAIEYVQIVDGEQLQDIECIELDALAAIAVKIGQTRLIDNKILYLNKT